MIQGADGGLWLASPWTAEDRVLMLARHQYRESLCPGCGFPKETAWHPDNEGWHSVEATFRCDPCTVREQEGNPGAEPVTYLVLTDTRDYDAKPLPDFTATRPAPRHGRPVPNAGARPVESPIGG